MCLSINGEKNFAAAICVIMSLARIDHRDGVARTVAKLG
jgi:hypothetical protein